jgi:hypothetical protein
MFDNNKAKYSTLAFVFVVLMIPLAALLIMNDQLTVANDITGMATAEPDTGYGPVFAGLLIIVLAITGVVSLLFKFNTIVKEKKLKKLKDVDSEIDALTEQLEKL